jgi:hypothetical protein
MKSSPNGACSKKNSLFSDFLKIESIFEQLALGSASLVELDPVFALKIAIDDKMRDQTFQNIFSAMSTPLFHIY